MLANPLALVGLLLIVVDCFIAFGVMGAVGDKLPEGSSSPLVVLFIFPLVGLVMLSIALITGRKSLALVTTGIYTQGKVVGKEATNMKINKQTVYKVFFEFKAQDGTLQRAFVRTHQTEKVSDEAEEKLVYNPDQPSEAILLDTLPKAVREFFEMY